MYFIGHTRFSQYVPKSNAWNVSNFTEEEYIAHLFSDERMKARMHIFAEISLPLLAAMKKNYDYYHIVVYSSILPKKWKDKLLSLKDSYPFLYFYESDTEVGNPVHNILSSKADGALAFFRLDDDDLLAINYLDLLSNYNNKAFKNMAVSFTKGVAGYYKNNNFIDFRSVKSKNYIAIGQAYIGYIDNGKIELPPMYSHHEIDEHLPVIVDARYPVYVHTHHSQQDTNYRFSTHGESEKNSIEMQLIKFPKVNNIDAINNLFPTLSQNIRDFFINRKPLYSITDINILNSKNITIDDISEQQTFEFEYNILSNPDITSSKAVVISLLFSNEVQNVVGLNLSQNENIGWYRYLSSEKGQIKGHFSFVADEEVKIIGLKIIFWDKNITFGNIISLNIF